MATPSNTLALQLVLEAVDHVVPIPHQIMNLDSGFQAGFQAIRLEFEACQAEIAKAKIGV